MKHIYLLSALAIVILSSCGGARKTQSIHLQPITIKPTNTEYRATATRYWDITHTRVALHFNMERKTATGQVWIELEPYGAGGIQKEIILDAKSMRIDSVAVEGNDVTYTYENDSLLIKFKDYQLRPKKLYIAYEAMPYKAISGGSSAITDDKGLYFINTDNSIPNKPVQIWTQGETQANSHWVPTIDKPNERFTTQIELTVPNKYVTLSNGELISKKEHGDTRTDIWKMDKPIQPYAMMFAIGDYTIVEDGAWKSKPINYYVEPEFAPYAKGIFKNTGEMMDFFSEVTHTEYPWNKYSQVVVRDFVSGAMENTTASVFGEFVNKTSRELVDEDNENVVAHELFHQWFGDYVTAESWSNITLNESFATFGEQLWRRHKYGKVSEQVLAYDDLQTYLGQAKENDSPLVRYYYNDREDVFDRISYQKGATILHYLEGQITPKGFNLAMKKYLQGNRLNSAEVDNWRLVVEEVCGRDMNWFFNQWYFRGGHPVLEFSYKFDDNLKLVTIKVEQKQNELYKLPLYASIVTDNSRMNHPLDINSKTSTFTFSYPDGIRPTIIPDAYHWLPGEIIDKKNAREWLTHYIAAEHDDYISKIHALADNYTKLNNKDIQALFKLAIHDTLKEIRVKALEFILKSEQESALKSWEPDMIYLAINDPSNHVRAAAFDVLGKWEIESAQEQMLEAINDSSYLVAGSALAALDNIEYKSIYDLSKSILQTNPRGDLQSIAWIIVGKEGLPADTNFFNKEVYHVFSRNKIDFVDALSGYMKVVYDNSAFENALGHVVYLINTENIKSYRSAMTSYLYEVAFYYKYDVLPTSTVNKANIRLALLIKALDKIEAAETNEKNLWEYKKYRQMLLKN